MQNCIRPPYSQNHFYAFDQNNLLKLQRNLNSEKPNYKRKYDDEPELNRTSSSKKLLTSPIEQSSPKTADHISINKYHNDRKTPSISDEKPDIEQSIQNQTSEQILSRLEKILNLCGELRSLAKDVEIHLHEQSISKTTSPEINPIKEYDSEQTIIDIYKELEIQQTNTDNNEKNAPPPYQTTHDTSSIHSESHKSIQLMVCYSPNQINQLIKFLFSKPNHLKLNHLV